MKALIFAIAILASTAAQADIRGYSCVGTEPFWSAQISSGAIAFEAPAESYKFAVGPRTDAAGMSEGYVSVYQSKNRKVTATVLEGTCSDGMSDNEYAKHIVLVMGKRVLYGCCEPLAQHDD